MRKQYSKEEITHILDRFMAGETSLAEEQLLADYFRTHEVNDEWREYKEMFALFDSGKVDIELTTSADRADSSFINHHPSVIIRHSSFAVIGIAAAIILAFLLWPESHKETTTQTEVKPVVAEANPQPVPLPVVEEKTEETVMAVVQPTPQPVKKHRKAGKKQSAPIEEPVLAQTEPLRKQEEGVPVIPADKQALADIYLAEEALQVAYEIRGQQEAIRAYAASLTGEEPAKPIITL
ncbi:MAG: hypothetical protein K6G70_01615 [Bacteroidaceae bacterium]|nr:hypothetical protein [Bacteroidaceae bacterium]